MTDLLPYLALIVAVAAWLRAEIALRRLSALEEWAEDVADYEYVEDPDLDEYVRRLAEKAAEK